LLASFGEVADHLEIGTTKNFASPEEDASQAIAQGDLSLRGVIRFVVFVPGIDADYESLRAKYRIKIIEGTSGVIVNDPTSYDARAERYAFAYNRYIFGQLGCNFERPMDRCKNYE
jgi:hypothetical protein